MADLFFLFPWAGLWHGSQWWCFGSGACFLACSHKHWKKIPKNMPPIQKERWFVSINKQGASPHKEISNKSESFEFKYDPWRSQSSFLFFSDPECTNLGPPKGYHISAPNGLFFGGFLGAQISHPNGGFRTTVFFSQKNWSPKEQGKTRSDLYKLYKLLCHTHPWPFEIVKSESCIHRFFGIPNKG